MNYHRILIFILVTMICFAKFSMAFAEPAAVQEPTPDQTPVVTSKIFLIIADGLQAETLQKTSVPNMNGIASSGVSATKVITVYPDTVQATVTSVLTGMLPEKHGFNNVGDKLNAQTIQQAMEGKKIDTSFFGAEGELKNLWADGGYNCSGPFNNSDENVVNNVLAEWSKSQSYLNVIVLPELRSVLNKHGVNSNEYKMAVTKTDSQIGRILRKLHEENSYEKSMIIITGTHGSPPIMMKGLPFKENTQSPPLSICDIAPTIGYLNGIELGKVNGMVLWNTFKNLPGQSEEYLLSQRIKDLSDANSHLLDEMNRLQEEKNQVKLQQDTIAKEKEDIQRQIEHRDKTILKLQGQIKLYHMLASVLIVILALSYFIFYRVLRKKFLMF
ncbi:alkaline phosphatase family protein [Desulforamulus aquiferis]|uniref:Alkaline phosphatase family protein n=1 Tax=Desulforamulus aquiferis TaxID=1397668 RepID=A0AAW7Z9R0_9FIRM|nr:alkaline phosphatase family protein [Desulforamulus aquiferis]MDO7786013.1 alkaline phosphatase family protein [Desulforamulus aquiferis]RYD04724.1 hypothetical protein N752_12420 [Desulforamulus aquiferis]